MSKALIISALVCAVASHVVGQEDIFVKYRFENPVIIKSNGYLNILWKTNTSIHLNSTKEDFTHCSITLDPIKDFAMLIQGKELPNHKFIVWGYRSYKDLDQRGQKFVAINYTALIVDPLSCSYKAVDIPEDKIPKDNWPVFYSHIVPLNDGFDLFSPGHGKCLPCRFSLEGELIPLKHQLELDQELSLPYMYNIQSVNDVDSSKGYIYTANFRNNTAVIKKIDTKFQVVKQAMLEHPIHSLSMNDNAQPVISICYASQNTADAFGSNNFSVHCEQLDSDFNTKFTVRLPVPDDRFVPGLSGITHQVDSFGNMFVGLMQLKLSDSISVPETQKIRLFMYENIGKLVRTRDLQEQNMDNSNKIFELRSHLTADKTFCIVFSKAMYKDFLSSYSDINELMMCLDVSK